jgi:hypothetical protein
MLVAQVTLLHGKKVKNIRKSLIINSNITDRILNYENKLCRSTVRMGGRIIIKLKGGGVELWFTTKNGMLQDPKIKISKGDLNRNGRVYLGLTLKFTTI